MGAPGQEQTVLPSVLPSDSESLPKGPVDGRIESVLAAIFYLGCLGWQHLVRACLRWRQVWGTAEDPLINPALLQCLGTIRQGSPSALPEPARRSQASAVFTSAGNTFLICSENPVRVCFSFINSPVESKIIILQLFSEVLYIFKKASMSSEASLFRPSTSKEPRGASKRKGSSTGTAVAPSLPALGTMAQTHVLQWLKGLVDSMLASQGLLTPPKQLEKTKVQKGKACFEHWRSPVASSSFTMFRPI